MSGGASVAPHPGTSCNELPKSFTADVQGRSDLHCAVVFMFHHSLITPCHTHASMLHACMSACTHGFTHALLHACVRGSMPRHCATAEVTLPLACEARAQVVTLSLPTLGQDTRAQGAKVHPVTFDAHHHHSQGAGTTVGHSYLSARVREHLAESPQSHHGRAAVGLQPVQVASRPMCGRRSSHPAGWRRVVGA